MTSAIDITKPVYGSPTTQSVRDNFSHASDEITALQSDVLNRVRKDGDVLTGDLTLFRDPTLALHAANRAWVINQIHSTTTSTIYIGDYNAATDRVLTSGQASIIVNQPLPAATSGNSNMYFTVKVGTATSVGNQPPGGVPVGSWLLSNGTTWNVYQPSAAGIVAQSVPVNPVIAGLPGTDVYAALSSVPALYLPLVGGNVSGTITAGTAPTLGGHLTNKTYVDALTRVNSFNTRIGAVVLTQTDVQSVGVLSDVGRNKIHNGMFNVAQRGNGVWAITGTTAYTVDRWCATSSGNWDVLNIQRLPGSDIDRSGIGDEAAVFTLYNNFTGNANAAAGSYIEQRIENARRLSGKTVTVSFWAFSGTALKLGVNMYQLFGSGGSPSAYVKVQATGTAITLVVSTWTRYSTTFVIPSTAGKTFGTNGDDSTWLRFFFSAGATLNQEAGNIGVQSGAISLWGVQLEIGTVMTPLEKIDPQQDFANCQRFYQFFPTLINQSYAGAGQGFNGDFMLPVTMRAGPSVVFSNQSYFNASAVVINSIQTSHIRTSATCTALGLCYAMFDMTLSADL
jgi:hypothetical protein